MKSEILLDAADYAALRGRLRSGPVQASDDAAAPLLVREAEAGIPTGRWMVLDRDRPRPTYWAWPPAASNDTPNAAAARHPTTEVGP